MRSARIILAIASILALQAASFAGNNILLKSRVLDPNAVLPTAHVALPEKDYYIVQFAGPIQEGWKREVERFGIELLDYIPEFAFIARGSSAAITSCKQLPFVTWVGNFLPEFKLSPQIATSKGRVRVNIVAFPGESVSALTEAINRGGGMLETLADGPRSLVRAEVPAEALHALTQKREVAWIEPYIEPRLTNRNSRPYTGVSTVWTDLGFYGTGQIVAVADTGLDNGQNDSTMSADFRGRILKAYDLGRKNKWNDPDGHGTHVCGSVLGNGMLSGANPVLHQYGNSFAGSAPEATLIIQSILSNNGGLGGLPANLNDLFNPPYADGARIHTNSWGAAYNGVYTSSSQQVDQFVWNHRDMAIFFSAGNGGKDGNSDGVVDLDSLDAPATAKNCITVGATESSISTNSFTYAVWPSDYPVNPIRSDPVANNPSGMAAFSSRGPTDDGRIKPDICAPGTNIISARSHVAGSGTLWGVYDANYLYSGGTSMSTPLTAGAAAVLRQFLINARGLNPSAALVKAALLNSATDINPGQYGTGATREIPSPRPNNVEGWGRLDLRSAIQPPPPTNLDFIDASGLSTGGSRQYNYFVENTTVPFKVTLAWTDYPGAVQAAKELVNDLDLTVTTPGGQILRGNGATDRTNNVETVDILSPAAGIYTITVSAYNVPFGPQPYALAVSGGFGEAPLGVTTIGAIRSLPSGTLVWIAGKVVTAGTEILSDHFYIEESDRTQGVRIQYPGGGIPTASGVYVIGRVSTNPDDELQIDADNVAILSSNNAIPEPLGIRNKDIGGQGVGGRHGAPNTGLLVRTWGQVISWTGSGITIDDGFGPLDVWTGALAKPAVGTYVSVTGISAKSLGQPIIKARFPSDIRTY